METVMRVNGYIVADKYPVQVERVIQVEEDQQAPKKNPSWFAKRHPKAAA